MTPTPTIVLLKQICGERSPRRSVFLPKPPKGTVPFGGFEVLLKMKKCSIYAALSHIKPPIGTVPFGGVEKSGLSIVIFSGRQGCGCPGDTSAFLCRSTDRAGRRDRRPLRIVAITHCRGGRPRPPALLRRLCENSSQYCEKICQSINHN